jgi:hypothetical protein
LNGLVFLYAYLIYGIIGSISVLDSISIFFKPIFPKLKRKKKKSLCHYFLVT